MLATTRGTTSPLISCGSLEVRLAESFQEIDEAMRLRFEVFNLELSEGLLSSYDRGYDSDAYDAWCDHLFSFAIWDRGCRRFIAARDRYGVKPFFYRETEDELLFASEAKGLLSLPRVPRAFSPDHVMTALVSAPLQAVSPFAGTEILRPGHYLIREPGEARARVVEYWRPRYAQHPDLSPEEAKAGTREVFQRAVRRRISPCWPAGWRCVRMPASSKTG